MQEEFGLPEYLFVLLGILIAIPVAIVYWIIKLPRLGIRKLLQKAR